MRLAAAAALLLCSFAISSSAHADDAALAAPIEQCIRGNAIKVSAAIPDLNQAVDFLVDKLCAKPIAEDSAAAQRAAMQKYADRQQKNCDDWKKSHAPAAPASGNEDEANPCQLAGMMGDASGFSWTITAARPAAAPPAAVALAAKLLLELRLAHENPPGR